MNSDKAKGNLMVFLCAGLWSTGGLLIKYLPWNGFVTNCIRSVVAFVFFLVVRKGRKLKVNKMILGGAISMAAVTTLFVLANKMTTAANAIVLQYLSPVFVLIMTCAKEKKRPTVRQLTVILVTLLGMVLFFLDQLSVGYMIGNILAVGSGVAFAALIYFNSQPKGDGEEANTLGFLLAFIIEIPFCFIYKPDITGAAVGAVLILGVFQIGLPHLIFAKSLKLTDPVSASLISTIEAVLNPIWVLIAFGERPGKYALIGGVIILSAITANMLIPEQKSNRC